MVAVGCRFSNQNTASLSPPLDSRSGHVTVWDNETWGNTTQAEVQKLVVNWLLPSHASATPETIHKEAEASLQGWQAMLMGMGWRFSHLSLPSWGLQYRSEAILDSLAPANLAHLKNQNSWLHRTELTIVLSHSIWGWIVAQQKLMDRPSNFLTKHLGMYTSKQTNKKSGYSWFQEVGSRKQWIQHKGVAKNSKSDFERQTQDNS